MMMIMMIVMVVKVMVMVMVMLMVEERLAKNNEKQCSQESFIALAVFNLNLEERLAKKQLPPGSSKLRLKTASQAAKQPSSQAAKQPISQAAKAASSKAAKQQRNNVTYTYAYWKCQSDTNYRHPST